MLELKPGLGKHISGLVLGKKLSALLLSDHNLLFLFLLCGLDYVLC